MKFFITLIISIAISVLSSAEDIKVAVIGNSPESDIIADLVLAELSSKQGIATYERNEIQKILQEQKLASSELTSNKALLSLQILHADIFAVLSASPNSKASLLLTVFNAKTGFLLCSSDLPSDTSEAAKEASRLISNAIQKEKSQTKYLMSICNIHTVAVPAKFKNEIDEFATILERRICNCDNIMALERKKLDKVLTERELSQEIYALTPSAILLRLEFMPGAYDKTVDLILRATDAANKELFRLEIKNSLYEPDEKCNVIYRALAEWIKTSPPVKNFSPEEEAQWLFLEYKKLKYENDRTAYYKITAAVALAPGNKQYRLAKLQTGKSYIPIPADSSLPPRLARIKAKIAEADAYSRDFPDAINAYSTVSYLFESLKEYYKPEYPLKWDKDAPAPVIAIAEDLRTKYFRERKKEFTKLNLDDGINSAEEFEQFRYAYVPSLSYCMYHEADTYSSDVTKLYEMALRYILHENPQKFYETFSSKYFLNDNVKKIEKSPETTLPPFLEDLFFGFTRLHRNEDDDSYVPIHARIMLIKKSGGIAALLKFQKNKDLKAFGELLRLHSDFHNNKISREQLLAGLNTWAEQNLTRSGNYKELYWYLSIVLDEETHKETRKISANAKKKLNNVLDKEPFDSWEKLQYTWTKTRDFNKKLGILKANRDLIQKNASTKEGMEILQNWASELMFHYESKYTEALPLLYPRLQFELLAISECTIGKAAISEEKIFFLDESDKNRLFCLDLKTKHLSKLPLPKDKYVNFNITVYKNNIFLIARRYRPDDSIIRIISPDTKNIRTIQNIPTTSYNAITIMNERIYLLQTDGTLFSCDMAGENRKIDVSRKREDKLNPLDNSKSEILSLLPDPARNCLLLGIAANKYIPATKSGIWEYFPNTGQFKSTECGRIRIGHMSIYQNETSGEFKLINLDKNPEEFLSECKHRTPGKRLLLYQEEEFQKSYGFVQPGQVWNNKNLYISGSPFETIPLPIRFTRIAAVFPHPDNKSLIYMDEKLILKISLLEK